MAHLPDFEILPGTKNIPSELLPKCVPTPLQQTRHLQVQPVADQHNPASQRTHTPLDPTASAFRPTPPIPDYKALADFPPLPSPPNLSRRGKPKPHDALPRPPSKRKSPVLNAPTAPKALRPPKHELPPKPSSQILFGHVTIELNTIFDQILAYAPSSQTTKSLRKYQRLVLSFASTSADVSKHVHEMVMQHTAIVKARHEAMAASVEATMPMTVIPAVAEGGRLLGELEAVLRELERRKGEMEVNLIDL